MVLFGTAYGTAADNLDGWKMGCNEFLLSYMLFIHLHSQMFSANTTHKVGNRIP